MAKFKCKNCDHVFEHFCDNYNDVEKAKCPECVSHWVELKHEKKEKFNPFPRGLYDDPIYPVPNFGPFPYNIPSPWPKDGWIVTCGISSNKYDKHGLVQY